MFNRQLPTRHKNPLSRPPDLHVSHATLPGHVALDDPALDVVAPLGHRLPVRGVDEVALRSVGGVVRHDGEHDHVEGEHHEDHAEAHQEQRLRELKKMKRLWESVADVNVILTG